MWVSHISVVDPLKKIAPVFFFGKEKLYCNHTEKYYPTTNESKGQHITHTLHREAIESTGDYRRMSSLFHVSLFIVLTLRNGARWRNRGILTTNV
jgi:hypothetical protein